MNRKKILLLLFFIIFNNLIFIKLVFSFEEKPSISFKVKTTVGVPQSTELIIIPWSNNSTIKLNNTINFSANATGSPLPGKSSYEENPSDGWTADSNNVGFDLICIGPGGSKLYITCGELNDGTGNIIRHSDSYIINEKTFVRKNFGMTVTKGYGVPVLVYDGVHRTGPPGPSNLIDTFGSTEYSQIYHIYNWLSIPAETLPDRAYFTNNYVITLL